MKNTLDSILEDYESNNETTVEDMSEKDYELWQYLCGDGDISHLHNYYDLQKIVVLS
jgi:hypothetical protein